VKRLALLLLFGMMVMATAQDTPCDFTNPNDCTQSHLACIDGKCVLVNGPGLNKCYQDGQCQALPLNTGEITQPPSAGYSNEINLVLLAGGIIVAYVVLQALRGKSILKKKNGRPTY
jgi:hypothetical protein